MNRQLLNRLAVVGALAFVAQGVTEIVHTEGDPLRSVADYGIEIAFAIGAGATLLGLFAFHQRVEASLPRFGHAAVRVAAGGQGLVGLVVVATVVRGHDVLGPLFPLGIAGWLFGTLAYCASVVRNTTGPRWQPIALGVGTLLGILVAPGGAVILGACWAALAIAGTAIDNTLQLAA